MNEFYNKSCPSCGIVPHYNKHGLVVPYHIYGTKRDSQSAPVTKVLYRCDACGFRQEGAPSWERKEE